MPPSPVSDTQAIPGWRDVIIGGFVLLLLIAAAAFVSAAGLFLAWLLLELAWAGLG